MQFINEWITCDTHNVINLKHKFWVYELHTQTPTWMGNQSNQQR